MATPEKSYKEQKQDFINQFPRFHLDDALSAILLYIQSRTGEEIGFDQLLGPDADDIYDVCIMLDGAIENYINGVTTLFPQME